MGLVQVVLLKNINPRIYKSPAHDFHGFRRTPHNLSSCALGEGPINLVDTPTPRLQHGRSSR